MLIKINYKNKGDDKNGILTTEPIVISFNSVL